MTFQRPVDRGHRMKARHGSAAAASANEARAQAGKKLTQTQADILVRPVNQL